MNTLFLGGSRRITRLNGTLREALSDRLEASTRVVVGDANGSDRLIQEFLRQNDVTKVTVFHTGDACRNNVGRWPTRAVQPPHKTKDFAYYTAKDAVMAQESDEGFMLWDGKSPGTIVNILRLLLQGKPVHCYVSREQEVEFLRDAVQLESMIDSCEEDDGANIREYLRKHVPEYAEPTLF